MCICICPYTFKPWINRNVVTCLSIFFRSFVTWKSWCAKNFYLLGKGADNRFIMWYDWKSFRVLSRRIRFHLKTQLFLYRYDFRPHVSDELETINENGTFLKHSPEWNFLKTLRTKYQFQSTPHNIRNLLKVAEGRFRFLSFIIGLISNLIACFQANLALLILRADYSRRRQNFVRLL